MKSINKKLEFLSKVALEDFDVDVLKIMRSEIKRKQEYGVEKKIASTTS